MSQEPDWLEDGGASVRQVQRDAAVEFTQNFLVFEQDPRARALLEMWHNTLAQKRTPVNAPHTEYAANEAVRAFVEGIYANIKLARTL